MFLSWLRSGYCFDIGISLVLIWLLIRYLSWYWLDLILLNWSHNILYPAFLMWSAVVRPLSESVMFFIWSLFDHDFIQTMISNQFEWSSCIFILISFWTGTWSDLYSFLMLLNLFWILIGSNLPLPILRSILILITSWFRPYRTDNDLIIF